MMKSAWMVSLLFAGCLAMAPGLAAALPETAVPAQVDPGEPIVAEPVDRTRLAVPPEPTPGPETEWITPQTLTGGEPYPIASATPTATLEPETTASPESVQEVPLVYPYAISAYLLPVNLTELDLGLIVYDTPGISAGIGWGAMRDLMIAARMTVQGPSNTAGVQVRYGLRSEEPAESKPAIAASFHWRFLNHRTNDEARRNIFRGNRLQGGVLLSKDMGSLARHLQANSSVQGFLNYFKLHAELLVEYLAGREHSVEEPVARVEFGARGTVEIVIDPEFLMLTFNYDSLPDWVGRDNYYLGIRYLARRNFGIDVLAGKIGEGQGLTAGLAWIF